MKSEKDNMLTETDCTKYQLNEDSIDINNCTPDNKHTSELIETFIACRELDIFSEIEKPVRWQNIQRIGHKRW